MIDACNKHCTPGDNPAHEDDCVFCEVERLRDLLRRWAEADMRDHGQWGALQRETRKLLEES